MMTDNMRKPWYQTGWGIAIIIIVALLAVWFMYDRHAKKIALSTTHPATETVTPTEHILHGSSWYIPDREQVEEPGKEATHKGIDMYTEGKYEEAKEFLEHGTAEGNADAKALLGKMYIFGYGIVKDVEKGVEYLEDAVEHGSEYAMAELGTLFVEGKHGVEKASDKGLELIRRAMGGSKYYGYLAMAKLYEAGDNVEQSTKKAIEYMEEAGKHGYRFAAEELEKLREKL